MRANHVACFPFRLLTRLWISSCRSSISHLRRNASYSPSVAAGRGKDFGLGAISQAKDERRQDNGRSLRSLKYSRNISKGDVDPSLDAVHGDAE